MSQSHSAVPRLVVDGRALDPVLAATVTRVEVDEREGLPHMLTLVLRDTDRDVVDRAGLSIGCRVEVHAGPLGASSTERLVCAEVLALEADYSERASTVTARGYDVSHRLHRQPRTRSWVDVTAADVVRRVAEDAGLDVGRVDDPGVVHEHLTQLERTDWDFVTALARDLGRVLRVAGEQVELVPREQATAAPEPGDLSADRPGQLVLGATVESVEARVTAAELPGTVEVRGWSAETKEPVVGSAPVAAPGVDIGPDPARLADGSTVRVVSDRAVATQQEADALATALAEEAGSTFARARVACQGDPALHAGRPVSLGLVGPVFSGRWTVTAALHTFDADGYRTTLDLGASPPHARPAPRREARGAAVQGPVPGVVTDVADPEARARVRVGLPWLSDEYVSDWARVVFPGAGPDRGLVAVPEVDDEVLVDFEQGDVRRPYVLGGLHNGVDVPPLEGGDADENAGEIRRRGLVSRSGHRVVLEDDTAAPGIHLVTGQENVRMLLDDDTTHLTIEAKGDVSVTAGGTATVSGRSVRVTGDQEVALEAPTISVEAGGRLSLRGGTVEIN